MYMNGSFFAAKNTSGNIEVGGKGGGRTGDTEDRWRALSFVLLEEPGSTYCFLRPISSPQARVASPLCKTIPSGAPRPSSNPEAADQKVQTCKHDCGHNISQAHLATP